MGFYILLHLRWLPAPLLLLSYSPVPFRAF